MMTKTIFKTVLLSVALTGTMVSCQKESEMIFWCPFLFII